MHVQTLSLMLLCCFLFPSSMLLLSGKPPFPLSSLQRCKSHPQCEWLLTSLPTSQCPVSMLLPMFCCRSEAMLKCPLQGARLGRVLREINGSPCSTTPPSTPPRLFKRPVYIGSGVVAGVTRTKLNVRLDFKHGLQFLVPLSILQGKVKLSNYSMWCLSKDNAIIT